MATHAHSTPTSGSQPDLRPYVVHTHLPAGCLAHIVREATCPLLHLGETIVVDPNDRTIAAGDLFVMESGRFSPRGPSRSVVEFKQRTYCIRDDDGEFRDAPCWSALFYSEMIPLDGSPSTPIRFSDGPVKLCNASYFEDRIVGRIVGILQPGFAEPMRLAA